MWGFVYSEIKKCLPDFILPRLKLYRRVMVKDGVGEIHANSFDGKPFLDHKQSAFFLLALLLSRDRKHF